VFFFWHIQLDCSILCFGGWGRHAAAGVLLNTTRLDDFPHPPWGSLKWTFFRWGSPPPSSASTSKNFFFFLDLYIPFFFDNLGGRRPFAFVAFYRFFKKRFINVIPIFQCRRCGFSWGLHGLRITHHGWYKTIGRFAKTFSSHIWDFHRERFLTGAKLLLMLIIFKKSFIYLI